MCVWCQTVKQDALHRGTCADQAAVQLHGDVARRRWRRHCRRDRLHAQLRQHLPIIVIDVKHAKV